MQTNGVLQPQPLSAVLKQSAGKMNIEQEINAIKQNAAQVRNAVLLLESEKATLRIGIRKLKMENIRSKQKIKELTKLVKKLGGTESDESATDTAPEAEKDYDDIGRDYILVGGNRDPLSLSYEVLLLDTKGIKHKSAERYYWYKIAETFKDEEAMKKILEAPSQAAAEEVVKNIKGFDEKIWNNLKLSYWEEGQRLKLEQVPWIKNVLVLSGTSYIAVASQDKFFGTGWRKNREESRQTIFWDGENLGGKSLMKLRHQFKKIHQWTGPNDEEESKKKYEELRRFTWRYIDPSKRRVQIANGGRYRGAIRGRGTRSVSARY